MRQNIVCFIALVVYVIFTQGPLEAAPSQGLNIHAVRMTGPGPATAGLNALAVSIDFDYDGSQGEIYLSTIAVRGEDWQTSSRITASVGVARTTRGTLVVNVNRPHQSDGETLTSHVVILASSRGVYPTYQKIVELPIKWPAVAPSRHHASDPSMAIVSALGTEKYQDIDRILSYWLDEERFDQDGRWKVERFYKTLKAYFELDRNGTLEKIRHWRTANPRSQAVALAEASYWVIYAADLRGNHQPGVAPSPDVLKVVRQYHSKATKILDQSRPYAANTPIWHWLQLKMSIDGNAGERIVNAAFDRAALIFPQYLPLYVSMAAYLTMNGGAQRWEKIKMVADRLAASTRTTHPGAYALLVDAIGELTVNFVPNLYVVDIAAWPQTRDSWKALIDRYGSSYNLNAFAAHACQADDISTLQTQLGKIGQNVIPEAWPGNYSYDMCRRRITLNT